MNISILGCGSIGTRHAKNLLKLGYKVNYIYDPIKDNSEILQEEATKYLSKAWLKNFCPL